MNRSYLIHTKTARDTNGNTYSATLCFAGHELALIIPKNYGAAENQHHQILAKLVQDMGLKNVRTFSELETFLGATIYRVTETATMTQVKNWGAN